MYEKLTGEVELANMQRKEERVRSHDVITRKPMSAFMSGTGNLELPQIMLCVLFIVINFHYGSCFILCLHSLLICIYTEVLL